MEIILVSENLGCSLKVYAASSEHTHWSVLWCFSAM